MSSFMIWMFSGCLSRFRRRELIFDAVGIQLTVVGLVERIGVDKTLKEFTLLLRDFVVARTCYADGYPAAAGSCVVAFLYQRVIPLRK